MNRDPDLDQGKSRKGRGTIEAIVMIEENIKKKRVGERRGIVQESTAKKDRREVLVVKNICN